MKSFWVLHRFGALIAQIIFGGDDIELAASATNQLAVDRYRQLATGDQNLCISDYSIETTLAMTFAGTEGETRGQMSRALHVPNDDDNATRLVAKSNPVYALTIAVRALRPRKATICLSGKSARNSAQEPRD